VSAFLTLGRKDSLSLWVLLALFNPFRLSLLFLSVLLITTEIEEKRGGVRFTLGGYVPSSVLLSAFSSRSLGGNHKGTKLQNISF